MADFIKGYHSNLYGENYLYNSTPMNYNPMVTPYEQNPYVQNNPYFNAQMTDTVSFGNTKAPVVNKPPVEKKSSNKTLLLLGGAAAIALGAIFHKNISKFLGIGEKLVKDSKGVAGDLAKESGKLADDTTRTVENVVVKTEEPAPKVEETIDKIVKENNTVEVVPQSTVVAKTTPVVEEVKIEVPEIKPENHLGSAKVINSNLISEVEKNYGKSLVEQIKKSNGEYFKAEEFVMKNSDGKDVKLILQKKYLAGEGMDAPQIDVRYKIIDNKENLVGNWDGIIKKDFDGNNMIYGHVVDTSFAKGPKGLGTKIKEFVKKEAQASGGNKVEINACWNSHVFHNKTGYKSNFYEVKDAKRMLEKVKSSKALDSLDDKISNALKSDDVNKINLMIDECLSFASKNKLRSRDIGLYNKDIPMILSV